MPVQALKRSFKQITSTIDPKGFRAIRRWEDLLENFTFHDLRRTAGTIMHKVGVDVKEIQHCMGHKHVSITYDIYVNPDQEKNADALQMLDRAINPHVYVDF